MAMFLGFFFLNSTVVKKKASQGDIIAEAMNKEANKRKKKTIQADAFKTIAERQKQLLDCINDSLKIEFQVLWQRKNLDDEFLKYYTNLGMRVLESTFGKAEEIRSVIFNIFEVVLKNKPEIFKQLQFSLINLLYEEDVVDNLVHFFSRAESVETQKLCTETMIMTVVCLNSKTNSTNAESQAIKNTRDFLSKLSETIPVNFYNNLQCFIKLYDSESYLLRNAITDIMANIIRKVLSGDSEEKVKNRDKFIMTLLQRIHDKNSHARAYVLNVLAQLVADNIVPKQRLIMMLKAGVDRLRDASVLTRKRAVLLIYSVLKVYQFIYSKDSNFRTQT
jgi:flagellar biosynthesis chaperone FliJ